MASKTIYYPGETAILHPRLQLAGKGDSETSSFNADFLEEDLGPLEDPNTTTKGIISSLMTDPSSRNPVNLIQARKQIVSF